VADAPNRLTPPYHPVDATGRQIDIGDVVRIVGVPDLNGMAQPYRDESSAVFRHLVGSYKRVEEFDEIGLVRSGFFQIRKGPLAGWHSIGIEPFLLKVKRSR